MRYGDGIYEIELFDHVELNLHGDLFEGQIVALHPHLESVTVRYWDTVNTRRDGEPVKRRRRVAFYRVDLERRDG